MKDQGYEHAHSSPIRTPQQLVVVMVLAFVIPVVGLILLAQFVISGYRAAQTSADPDAVARRIQPVARVEFGDAPAAATPAPATPAAPAASAPAAAAPAAAAPAAAAAAPAADKGKATYNQACIACHGQGVAGAPKFGDKAAWAPRIKTGMDALYTTSLKGKGAMPPKGAAAAATDADIRAAVEFMLAQLK